MDIRRIFRVQAKTKIILIFLIISGVLILASHNSLGKSEGEGLMTGKGEHFYQKATFAAGCFWGVEETFRQTKGIVSTKVGYAGGFVDNPSYEMVCMGTTGHAEAVEVEFDPAVISYDDLLDVFWNAHDPTTLNRQGPDVGEQYRSAIFFHTQEQEAKAKESKEELISSGKFKKPIVTQIAPAQQFFEAEQYHQQYYKKRGGKGFRFLHEKELE